jgi:cysteine dioxygenase
MARTLPALIRQVDRALLNQPVDMRYALPLAESYCGNDWQHYRECEEHHTGYRRIRIPLIDHCVYDMYLLVFPPGIVSLYHSHPANGCVLRVLEGMLEEDRITGRGEPAGTHRLEAGDVSYMHDSVGFHRIRNPSQTQTAYSLHLYSPTEYIPRMFFTE